MTSRDLHLSLAQLQHLGQPLPLRGGQVLLRLELLLQLHGLLVGEADLAALPLVERPLDEGAPQQRFTWRGAGQLVGSVRFGSTCQAPNRWRMRVINLFTETP